MSINWSGVMPAVTTKFKADDTLDFDLFSKNIEAQLAAGVNGIILGGTLGEASTLLESEKSELVRHTVKIVDGKVPVLINIAEQTTKGAIKAAKKAEEDGAKGLMVLPPMRYNALPEETVAYFSELAKNTSLPIMIYNNPVDYKIEVTLDMFEELLKFDNIQAVKESTRDVSNVTRLINRFGDRIKILTGVDTIAAESIIMGAHGWVAGLVCAFPRETVAIFKLIQQGRIKEAIEIHRWFFPLLELDINAQLVQNIKLAEVATGIGSEQVRAPRQNLTGANKERVLQIIKSALAVRPDLSKYNL